MTLPWILLCWAATGSGWLFTATRGSFAESAAAVATVAPIFALMLVLLGAPL